MAALSAASHAGIAAAQSEVAGLTPASYIGTHGLYGRADLAGLNLAQYPAILVELGNMRNKNDAGAMESPAGRQRFAQAVINGIVAYLRPTG